jgi:hypothetical protein
MSARLSLNRISSFSLRGNMPGSVQAVRNKTLNTKINRSAPTIGMATVNFSDKNGQLKNK